MTKMLKLQLLAMAGMVALVISPAVAQSPPASATTTDPLIQKEFKQQQIRTSTQKLSEQLATLLDEFERNGLGGDDITVLRSIRSVLGNLTDKEMEKVIDLLQQARSGSDPAASRQHVLDAFSGQKGIIAQLRQLILEYRRQLALYDLSQRFAELAARQGKTLQETVAMAKLVNNKTLASLTDGQKDTLAVQQAEQHSLAEEVKPLLEKLDALSGEGDSVSTDLAKSSAQQAKDKQLLASLQAADEDLRAANLLSAAGSQKNARDQLRDLARLLAPAQDDATALRLAVQELDKAIKTQKEVMAETKTPPGKQPDVADLESQQADVVDQVDQIRKEVQNRAPAANPPLQAATDKMQEARAALAENKKDAALPKQDEALAGMQQARDAINEQLAKAELNKPLPADPLAKLKQLQKENRELMAQQDQVKKASAEAAKNPEAQHAAAAKEAGLKDQAHDLQRQAAPVSPRAAQAMGEAADQMNKAEQALANQQNAPEAQRAAMDALARADQQLGQEIRNLEQGKQELAADQDARAKLAKIILAEQRLELATVKAPASTPFKELATQQGQIAGDTDQLRQQVLPTIPDAASALGTAGNEMGDAKTKLDRLDPKSARSSEQNALDALFKAKDALDARVEALQAQLGQPQKPDAQAMADAAQQLGQAQQDVNEAMNQMQPAAQMAAMQQQQQQIAAALQQMQQAQQPPSAPLNQAQQAAQQAAQQLAKNNLPAAMQAMQQAQQAMQNQMKAQGQPPAQPPDGQPQAGQPEPGKPEAGQPGNAPGQGEPSLPELAQQQAQVMQDAKQMAGVTPQQAAEKLQQAAEKLEQAAQELSPLATGNTGPLPGSAKESVEQAQQAMAKAAANAAANSPSASQAAAAQAAQALAQAQASMSLAQAGMQGSPKPGPGQKPGPGTQPGNQPGSQPGNQPGSQPGSQPGTQASQQGSGSGNKGGPNDSTGKPNEVANDSQYIGLPARDRQAIKQSKAESYPQEYGPLVEQYLKNLADQSEGLK